MPPKDFFPHSGRFSSVFQWVRAWHCGLWQIPAPSLLLTIFVPDRKSCCQAVSSDLQACILHRRGVGNGGEDPSVQLISVAQSCLTLCDPMSHRTPGLPVHHQLLESTQTHIHRVSDAIQPSHPLSSPSPPAPNLSQHQGLFQ